MPLLHVPLLASALEYPARLNAILVSGHPSPETFWTAQQRVAIPVRHSSRDGRDDLTSDRRDTAILAADVRRSVLRAWVSLAAIKQQGASSPAEVPMAVVSH